MGNIQDSRLWTRAFLFIWLAHLALTTGFYSVIPVFPLFLEDNFGLTGFALGLVVASYTASAIMTRPPTGYCLDRFGRKRIYLSGYCFFALAYLLYPLAGSVLCVTLTRFFHGALWGVTMGAANTAAIDLLPPEKRGEGIGYFGLAMILGMSVGPALGAYAADRLGYTAVFQATCALTLTGFLFLCCIRFPVIPKRVQPFSASSLVEPSSLPISMATLVFCIPYGAITNYSAMFARELPGASAGLFFLLLAIGTASTRLFAGKSFDRSGPGTASVSGYVFLLTGCSLLSMAKSSLLFSMGGLFIGFGYGMLIPVVQAMVNALVPAQRRGAANATMMTAFDLGICIGLVVTNRIQEAFGWSATYGALFG